MRTTLVVGTVPLFLAATLAAQAITRSSSSSPPQHSHGRPTRSSARCPRSAPHPAVAEAFAAFAAFVLSERGRTVMREEGFDVPEHIEFHGPELPPSAIVTNVTMQ